MNAGVHSDASTVPLTTNPMYISADHVPTVPLATNPMYTNAVNHGAGWAGAGAATDVHYAGAGVGLVFAVPFEMVVDPTYSGYEAPNGSGTAA